MWRIIGLAATQSAVLAAGQVFLKAALLRMLPFGWTRAFWMSLLTNWRFAVCGLLFASAGLLWMYMLKHYPLSVAYPLVSLSYVFGMVAAMLVFHEAIPAHRWIGVALIMAGCCVIVQ